MSLQRPGRRFFKVSPLILFICLVAYLYIGNSNHISHTDIDAEDSRHMQQSDDVFLKPSNIAAHCQKHGWEPIDATKPRKVYDLFMVNSELDWLEIRLNELYHYVDYFVILEAPTTFTGLPKPLLLRKNWAQFEKFESKIIYHTLKAPSEQETQSEQKSPSEQQTGAWSQWDYEKFQRDAMFTQIFPFLKGNHTPNVGDAIIVSDLDEIPRPATLTLLRYCDFPKRLTLRSRFYYYGFQWLHRGSEWAHPQATTYAANLTVLPQDLRGGHGTSRFDSEKADLWNAAWHCSSCFSTIEEMLLKMKSFSHIEYNTERFREKKRIVEYIRSGKDLWDRWGQWYKRIDNNEDIPNYLKQNRQRFGYMLDRDGKSAGFLDFDPNEEKSVEQ